MAKSIANIPAVEQFIVEAESTNLDKKWKNWLEDFTLYLDATGITQDAQRKAFLLHLNGKNVKNIYRSLQDSEDKFHDVVQKLNDYFQPKKNVTFERYVFKQAKHILSETCEFHDENEEIRDHFVTYCCSKSLKQKLLKETDLTLEKCINIGRSTELAKKQAAQIESVEIERRSSNEIQTETLEEKINNFLLEPILERKLYIPRQKAVNKCVIVVEINMYMDTTKSVKQK